MISRRSLLAAVAALPAALLAFKRGKPALEEPAYRDAGKRGNLARQHLPLTGMDLAADVRRWLIHISPNPSRGPSIIRLPEREWRDLRATVGTYLSSRSWPDEPTFYFKGVPCGISNTAARSAFWFGA